MIWTFILIIIQEWFVPNLSEIGVLVLEKIFKDYVQYKHM
jgi:hypothetical protein